MTDYLARKRAALEFEQHTAGVELGRKTGRTAVDALRNGATEAGVDAVHSKIKETVVTAVDRLAIAGVARRYREAFDAGYWIAVRATISTHKEDQEETWPKKL